MMLTVQELTKGWAQGRKAFAHKALALWLRLAERVEDVAEPWWLGHEAIEEMRMAHDALFQGIGRIETAAQALAWAKCALNLAGEWEDNPPNAGAVPGVGYGEGPGAPSTAVLCWDGTFTAERAVSVFLWDTDDGLCARLEWDSGTGKPSRFLGIETLIGKVALDLTDWGAG